LSPLYVSVHATDPDLRTRILGRRKTDDLAGKIKRLVKHRIRIHAQVVLMPGINDGEHLKRTIEDLYDYYPGVQSIAVVPLGLSDHGTPREQLKPVTPDFCRKTIRQVEKYQEKFRLQTGEAFVYLGDEFYIQGAIEIPEADRYDDFAQIEDGVGMVRTFLDAFESELKLRKKKRLSLGGTLITGTLFFPLLQESIQRYNRKFGSRLKVCAVKNSFMGKSITVAGLLAGQDIVQTLRRSDPGDFIVIPYDAISGTGTGEVLLDDVSLEDLSEKIGKPVFSSGYSVGEFFDLMEKQSAVRS
jgi:putative radical SAM enzyme (TIGR03279 family)